MGISEKINKLMEKRGLSRYKLAKLSKVPYTTLIKVLDGTTKNPQIETLSAIAEVLEVPIDKLTNMSLSEALETLLKLNDETLESLAAATGLKIEYLKNLDNLIPTADDYEAMDRISEYLKWDQEYLHVVMARQEPPMYEGPYSSAAEDFADFGEFDEETRLIARDVKALKPENKELLKSIIKTMREKEV